MQIGTILIFIILAIVIYLFLKFIISPLIRLIISLIIFLILIHILTRFFGLNLETAFGIYGKYLDINNWPYINLLTGFIDKYIDMAIIFIKQFINKLPK